MPRKSLNSAYAGSVLDRARPNLTEDTVFRPHAVPLPHATIEEPIDILVPANFPFCLQQTLVTGILVLY